jgi:hypothetical protein
MGLTVPRGAVIHVKFGPIESQRSRTPLKKAHTIESHVRGKVYAFCVTCRSHFHS